jgi:hypothetical protein
VGAPRCGVWPESGPEPDLGGEVSPLERVGGAPGAGADALGAEGELATGGEPLSADDGALGAGGVATGAGRGAAARGCEAAGEADGTGRSLGTGGEAAEGLEVVRVGGGAVALMAGVSGVLGRGEGWAGGTTATGAEVEEVEPCISCLIWSTADGSKLARALSLTSRPHRWIRSSNSWLLRPNSFANSWTRVDNGNSSWVGPRPTWSRTSPIVQG